MVGVPRKDTPKETPPADEDRDSSRAAPVLGSLSFDPSEVSAGKVTTLLIQLTDELSGHTAVSGNLQSPSGAAILPFDATYENGGSVYAVSITIPSQAEAGVWHVTNLVVLNQASYSLTDSFTAATVPAGGTLRVSSQEPDSTPPVVRDISVEKATLHNGEKNLIRIEIEDDRSGVTSVKGAFQSPSKSALVWFACRLISDSGLWEGEVPIPVNAECGEWTLQQIRAVDGANNLAYLSSDSPFVARVGFGVLGQGDCDSTPPTLEVFDLSPRTVSNETGAEILVTATVRDDGSGASSVFGWTAPASTNGQDSKIYFSCTQNPNDREAPWTGKILVPRYAVKGTWKVGLVHLEDKARNARDYRPDDPVIAGATFVVE